jgi:hypothetical protein
MPSSTTRFRNITSTRPANAARRIAFGERAGQSVRRIGSGFGDEGERPALTGTRCASINGFSVHANTHIPAHRRDQLEQLLRYTGRGPVVLERLSEDADGNVVYRFNRPWSDGTTGITWVQSRYSQNLGYSETSVFQR